MDQLKEVETLQPPLLFLGLSGINQQSLLWHGLDGAGYKVARPLRAMGDGAPVCWAERVLVVRSPPLAQRQQATLEKRLAAAGEAHRLVSHPPHAAA